MHEKFIAKVPTKCIAQEQPQATRRWQGKYNVVAWLRFQSARYNHAALIIKFIDDTGMHEVIADQCRIELSTTVLLSGQIEIEAQGRIAEMSVFLRLTDPSVGYVFDELYVQHVSQHVTSDSRMISAA